MTNYTPHKFLMRNGERVTFYRSEQGEMACPVCGEWLHDPTWFPSSGRIEDVDGPIAPNWNVCPTCNTEFGVDDGAASTAPIGLNCEIWSRLRLRWLDSIGWPKWALDQLETRLGISSAELERGRARKKD